MCYCVVFLVRVCVLVVLWLVVVLISDFWFIGLGFVCSLCFVIFCGWVCYGLLIIVVLVVGVC